MARGLRIGYPRQYRVAGEFGSYATTGQSAGLARAVTIQAERGSYTATGRDATLSTTAGSSVDEITSFTLTSPVTTSVAPFSIGIGFKMGDVSPGFIGTSLANYQVAVKRTWADGSVKHAIISGTTSLTANVAQSVSVTNGATPTGTALTSTDIQNAAPTATVQCGSFGTVSLATLLASPVRTWVSGHRMVECHYRADVGGGTLLSVWFHVKLWANGTLLVRAIVENGYIDNGSGGVAANADRSYVPTVVVAGSTVYNNSGAALLHCRNTRWMAEGWIGTNPQVTPAHSVTYLRASKLVPNYGWRSPSAAALNALSQTYSPMGSGNQPTAVSGPMHTGGNNPWHGLLPDWAGMFCASGDARAYRAVLCNSSSLNSFPIVQRSKSTNGVALPSEFPTWTADFAGVNTGGPGGNGIKEVYTSASPQLEWEYHHNPNEGYLAYILTGDYWHLETLAFQAATKYFWNPSANGSGTGRLMKHSETRGTAWCMRDVGCYAAIAPDGDATAAEYRTWLQTGGWNFYAAEGPENAQLVAPGIGIPATWSTYSAGSALTFAMWQINYWTSVVGFLWDIEPGHSDTTKHLALRNFMYKSVVGYLGTAGSTNYCYTRAGEDSIRLSDTVVAAFEYRNASIYYGDWGQVWLNTFGSSNTACSDGGALLGTSGGDPAIAANGRWGINLPAISYAVDHGATGAQSAWNRLTGASNWSSVNTSGFDNSPRMGVKPRNTNEPAWLTGQALNTWFEISGTSLGSAMTGYTDPLGSTPFGGVRKDNIGSYSGAAVGGLTGRMMYFWGGGHTDYAGNEILALDLGADTPTVTLLIAPTPNSSVVEGQRYYSDGRPISRHTYWETWYTSNHRLMFIGCGSYYNAAGGAANWVDGFDLTTNTFLPSGHGIPNVPTGVYNPDIPQCQDTSGNIWVHTKDGGTLQKFTPSTSSWTGFSATTTSGQMPLVYDSTRNRLVHIGPSAFARVYNAPSGSNTSSAISWSGTSAAIAEAGGCSAVYCPDIDRILLYRFSSSDNNIYQVNPSTFEVTTYSVSGTPPVRFTPSQGDGAAFNNVYGRFNIIPSLKIIVCRSNLPTSVNLKAFRYGSL